MALKEKMMWAELKDHYKNRNYSDDQIITQWLADVDTQAEAKILNNTTLNLIFGHKDVVNFGVPYNEGGTTLSVGTPASKKKGNDNVKKVVKFIGKKNGNEVTTFNLTNDTRIKFERSIRCTDIKFNMERAIEDNDVGVLWVDVVEPDGANPPTKQDDTDSSFIDCEFLNFGTGIALLYNGRNLLIERCKFTGTTGTGIHHYFKDIYEDPKGKNDTIKPGACRKNRVQGTTFNMGDGHAMKIGVPPDVFNNFGKINNPAIEDPEATFGRLYGNYLQFQILDCTITNAVVCEARLANKQVLGGFSCINTTASNGPRNQSHILVRGEGGILGSIMLLDSDGQDSASFNGSGRLTHALDISSEVDVENKGAIYIDTNVTGYTDDYYYMIGKFGNSNQFPGVKVMGKTSGLKNRVGYYKDKAKTKVDSAESGTLDTIVEKTLY